ncbi:hypothetical protein ACIPWL_08085 [Streptomyces sp. NPDC090023]|uniref:hypothetical protein n=1 Tax=unclassified Streptomyces TaxID=2593676 RepID=UPI003801503F
MILRVADRYRGAHALGLLDGVLRQAPRERLAPLLVSGDRAVRRYAYRMAVEEGTLSPVELARAAAEDDDAVIQGRCAEAALAGSHPRCGARRSRRCSTGPGRWGGEAGEAFAARRHQHGPRRVHTGSRGRGRVWGDAGCRAVFAVTVG